MLCQAKARERTCAQRVHKSSESDTHRRQTESWHTSQLHRSSFANHLLSHSLTCASASLASQRIPRHGSKKLVFHRSSHIVSILFSLSALPRSSDPRALFLLVHERLFVIDSCGPHLLRQLQGVRCLALQPRGFSWPSHSEGCHCILSLITISVLGDPSSQS